jgi:mannose-1-phosphate guanylyltransferase/mannose-6-phosphate isomerase
MITVIIAGGSGTRLWPLSTPQYPKHLLKLIDDESLMQGTYRRAKQMSDHVYVITEIGHAQHVKEQLPELSNDEIIIEPGRRGTASCVVAALHHLQSRHAHDVPVAFLHADHYVRDVEGFANSFNTAQEISVDKQSITMIGIEPTYPAVGFGYIQKGRAINKGADGALAYNVPGFKEKPEFDVAKSYLRSGRYLWNCGYFVGTINTFLEAFQTYSPQWKAYYDKLLEAKTKESYEETYLSFDNDTIDYALIEKAQNLLVVPATFDWMDLGSFSDAHAAAESDKLGNYVQGKVEVDTVENSYIRNEEADKPLAVIGLDNIVVINTPNGILVARKDLSQRVGAIAKKIQAQK